MQTVPSFDKRFNVEAPVTLIKAWVFIREGHRYQDAYPTADLHTSPIFQQRQRTLLYLEILLSQRQTSTI